MIYATTYGNLGKDPEIIKTKNDKQMVVSSIATKTGWGNNEKTVWINIRAFGKTGELIHKMYKKGDRLAVMGEFSMDEYKEKLYPSMTVDKLIMDLSTSSAKKEMSTEDTQESKPNQQDPDDDLPF